jgi:predicted Zn-dependent peptidase
MTRKAGMLCSMLALCVLVIAPYAVSFDFSTLEQTVSEHTLDNGLTILVMERHDAPVASLITYVNVGGVDDPKEYTGLAHMFEHMAFKGTTTLGTKDIEKELEAMGVEDSLWAELRAERKKGAQADTARVAALEAEFDAAIEAANEFVEPNAFGHILETEGGVGLNAGTGMDMTVYLVSLPSNRLELWMAMESERFLNPVLREMYRERNVITEERRMTLENSPIGRLIDAMKSAAFTAHPYGISIVGHMSDIKNYTRAAAQEYYNTYYVPSNMVVSIAGDVEPKEVFKLAEKYFGRLPVKAKPEPVATVEPEQKGERTVTLEDPAQPFLALGYHIPQGIHPDWPAIEALSDYLGQGRTSLLYQNLVKDKKIAANVGVYPGYPANKYPSLMLIYAMPSPGHDNDECMTEMLAEIEKVQSELLPEGEVEKIKARAKASFINGLTSNMGMAQQLAGYQTDRGDWRELFKELDRINAVTAEDIQRVAQEYLSEKNRTTAKLNTLEG